MKVILPAAGYGTRMKSITGEDGSKILLDMDGKPVIERCLEKILEIGDIDGVLIVSNEKFHDSFKKWKEGYLCKDGVKIEIYNDGTNSNEERLGTMGDIEFALREGNVQDDFLVINPDNLFPNWNLADAYQRFRRDRSVLIGIVEAVNLEEAKKKGNPKFLVPLDRNTKVVGFEEKDPNANSLDSSIGIYFFPSETKERITEYLKAGNNPDTSGKFIGWLVKEGKAEVYGFDFGKSEGNLFDIGNPKSYDEAQRFYNGIK